MRVIVAISLVVIILATAPAAKAGILVDRLNQFPAWLNKPALKSASGDLFYPDWMEGNWEVTSTLIEQVAPLAPEIITPGFEKNRRFIDQPVKFEVKFEKKYNITGLKSLVPSLLKDKLVVADRAFNGKQIATAYLDKDKEITVTVDPNNPNRQLTILPQQQRLLSTITNRSSEKPSSYQFLTTEITQQIFESPINIYVNEVESFSAYQLVQADKIQAIQITAIYLSPQDPNFFKAAGRPGALYRYKLELVKKL